MGRHICLAALFAVASLLLACNPSGDPDGPDTPSQQNLAAPANVTLHGSTETTLTFQWSAVEGATGYSWRLSSDAEATRDGSVAKRNVTIEKLTPGTAYRFSVCAVGSAGKSEYSSELSVVTQGTAPGPSESAVCVDAPVVLSFDSKPTLGHAGLIKVYTASGTEVDRIDLADLAIVKVREDASMVPLQQMVNDTKFNTFMDALPCSGKWRVVNCTPLRVEGKSLVIKPHSGVLKFDTEYYVTVDEGVVEGFGGIKPGEFSFRTGSAPASDAALTVAPDGSGDFCTIQCALDYAAKDGCVISLAPGTYNETLYLRDKSGITLKGASRDAVRIVYPNCEAYANGSGGNVSSRPVVGGSVGKNGGRSLFLVENCDNLTLQDLTIENSFGELKGQAECIYFNSGSNAHRLTVEQCSLLSYQDTFLCKGVVWVHNSLIAGHCDFIWGYPKACLFEDCEIRARSAGYIIQARVPSAADKGFVFLNCELTAEDGVKDGSMYLARSAGQADCWDNVVYVNCRMGAAISPAGWYTNPAPNPAVPTATSGWREYGSVDASGKPVTGHNAYGRVLTADEAAAYSSRQAVLGF